MLVKYKRLSLGLLGIALCTSATFSFAKDAPAKAEPAKEESAKMPDVSADTVVATVNGVDITMQNLG
ncbi:MAG: hypothetical protein DSZ28_03790, partial [Thiothrix sp.]